MVERAKKVLMTTALCVVLIFSPSQAYAADAEDWATLNGWLAQINGELQLIYGEVQNIYDKMDDLSGGSLTSADKVLWGNYFRQISSNTSHLVQIEDQLAIANNYLSNNTINKLLDGMLWIDDMEELNQWMLDNNYANDNLVYKTIEAILDAGDYASRINTKLEATNTYLRTANTYNSDINSKLQQINEHIVSILANMNNGNAAIDLWGYLTNDMEDGSIGREFVYDLRSIIDYLYNINNKLDKIFLFEWDTSGNGDEPVVYSYLWYLYDELTHIEATISDLEIPGGGGNTSGITSRLDVIIALLSTPDVNDIIGDFDYDGLLRNAEDLRSKLSTLAPFGAFALISAMLAIWSQSSVLTTPRIEVPFNFFGSGNSVSLDMSWLTDIQPVIDFCMISLLILCLVNASVRIIEMEATG